MLDKNLTRRVYFCLSKKLHEIQKALLVTLIIILILAGISLSGLIGEKGLFQRTEKASNIYNEAKAREVLETVLLTDGQYEKNTNSEYNQDEFLDALIKKEIPGSNIKGDVAIIGGEYAYELDRSVPKIGRYLGKASGLVFPTVTVTEPVLAKDYRSASFTITASEEKKGINKIEVWLLGEIVEEYTYTDGLKTPRTETYITNRNGIYTIKAYADLMGSTRTTVEGIVPTVEFSPNGSEEWKKEHSTKVTVKEIGEKVKSLKYKWTNSAKAPAETEFTEVCPNDNVVTGKDMNGTWFLWVLLETETGKTNICVSKGFNFDNQGPNITSFTSSKNSETEITLNATAIDVGFGTTKFEFYVDDVLKDTQTCEATTNSVTKSTTISGLAMGKHNCVVIVYDASGHQSSRTCEGATLMYGWSVYNVVATTSYRQSEWSVLQSNASYSKNTTFRVMRSLPTFCAETRKMDKCKE